MNFKNIIKTGIASILLIVTLMSNTAFAQQPPTVTEYQPDIDDLLYKYTSDFTSEPTTTDYIASLPEDDTPGQIFGQLIFYLLVLSNILAFISFVIAGVMMVMSQGNDEELSKSKRIFMYTVLALVICATALAFVTGITKFNFFNP